MIARLKADFSILWLCRRLGVSRSGYYEWAEMQVNPSKATQRRNELAAYVLTEFQKSSYSAGRRTITARLRNQGHVVNVKLVARIMAEEGLIPAQTIRARKKHAARQLRPTDPGDLLHRDFTSETPGVKLVGDITQITTGEGWVYLATVIDLFNREVIGYAVSDRMKTDLIIAAFTMTKRAGLIAEQPIFHTDHGSQYASTRFIRYCRKNRITRSMGERFHCWDNAVAESFFSRLKNERLHSFAFATRDDAITQIVDYIDYYNRVRPHSTNNGATPVDHRTAVTTAA